MSTYVHIERGTMHTLTAVQTAFLVALRSDNYEQARGALRKPTSDLHDVIFDLINDKKITWAYCCLGVACDVVHKELKIGNWGPTNGGFRTGEHTDWSVLPEDVAEALGKVGLNPALIRVTDRTGYQNNELISATSLNDGHTMFSDDETVLPTIILRALSFADIAFLFEYRFRMGKVFEVPDVNALVDMFGKAEF